MVEAVGVLEDLGMDLLARDPVINTVQDRRSCLDGADLGVVAKAVPHAWRDALSDGVLDAEPATLVGQNGHQLTRSIEPVDLPRSGLPSSLIGLPQVGFSRLLVNWLSGKVRLDACLIKTVGGSLCCRLLLWRHRRLLLARLALPLHRCSVSPVSCGQRRGCIRAGAPPATSLGLA
jgi:hypothetical protein